MKCFPKKPFLIGVVHLPPLPGSSGFCGEMGPVLERAVADAVAIADTPGTPFSALVIENFGDAPFYKTTVPPETIAAMARVHGAIRSALKNRGVFIGFNVLRNDPLAAIGLCGACAGDFIRVNVHTGAMVTDQGVIEGNAAETVRTRDRICPETGIFADILVKHAAPLAPISLEQAAKDTWHRSGANGLIVSGTGTGEATSLNDLEAVRAAVPDAQILVGSGATVENAHDLLKFADGLIIGTALKRGGDVSEPVDPARVLAFGRSQKSEVRSQKSEVRSQKTEN